mmetsp:Transcript_32879/g.37417  ORF Transcript_32879/g.37417 Transcript_32879/m.37417 type:complete len:476 (+) Transcript_32879:194-1621(+)|eukprot:CAMPEP_0194135830 /NCGR_PEP_ID=MMETSP0152-20130528/5906_1 /TAXON_ID=1049557 /ORGANISM="Thalassiothrix antarctica, Strain L6-D1" /LENGTH=475 /DNA_ID=CAMNT_0038832245 /DNA_START=185 /DNA_END=1612 /DNA_ORIENTATION=+
MTESRAMVLYVKKTNYIEKASISVNKKKSEAEDMTTFVKNTKRSLELQMLKLRNQLAMTEDISKMPDEVKVKFLFSNLDKDSNSRISVSELSDGLRKVNAGFSFQEGLEQAIKDIAMNDGDGDATLDREEFREYLNKLTMNTGITFQELSEFILMQIIFSEGGNTADEETALKIKNEGIDKVVKNLAEYYNAFNDVRTKDLFEMFDADGDGTINFQEVALGLYKIMGIMSEATKLALDVILLTDADDNRRLNYNEFVRVILHICALEGEDFEPLVSEFVVSMYFAEPIGLEDAPEIGVAVADYNGYKDWVDTFDEAMDVMNVLMYAKMQKLFDLWDVNNDGSISWEEFALGCHKYQQSVDNAAAHDAVVSAYFAMEEYDIDKNQGLEKQEFAKFLVNYAKESNKDVHELIDTLAVISLMRENSEEEERYIKALTATWLRTIKYEESYNKNENDDYSYSVSFKNFASEDDDDEMWA